MPEANESGKRRRKKKRLPVFLTGAEQDAIMQAARDSAPRGVRGGRERNEAIIGVGIFAGLRVSEITNLDVGDLDFEEGYLTVQHGKGDKPRVVPINSALEELLKDWLNVRVPEQDDALFISRQHRRISRRQVDHIVRRTAAQASIQKKISPHKLRHTFATSLLRNEVPVTQIQSYLGHEDINTTMIYSHVAPRRSDVETLVRRAEDVATEAVTQATPAPDRLDRLEALVERMIIGQLQQSGVELPHEDEADPEVHSDRRGDRVGDDDS